LLRPLALALSTKVKTLACLPQIVQASSRIFSEGFPVFRMVIMVADLSGQIHWIFDHLDHEHAQSVLDFDFGDLVVHDV